MVNAILTRDFGKPMTSNTMKIFLPGAERDAAQIPVPTGLGPLTALQGMLELTPIVATSTSTGAARTAATGASAEPRGFEVEPDDLLEIELENGLRLWQTVGSAQSDYARTGAAPASRSAQDAALLVPHTLPLRSAGRDASRGVQDYAVKGVSVLRGVITGKIGAAAGEAAARAIARHIESTLDLGLHRLGRPTPLPGAQAGAAQGFTRTPADHDAIPTDAPILVLLHGTFSSIDGSFSQLLDAGDAAGGLPLWERLERAFPGGIYGFEHRSVTESPVQNASDLVKALPEGARVSLLSYSRGGLIAELIARTMRHDLNVDGAFDAADRAILRKAGAREEQVAELSELKGWLTRRKLAVERIVRVAGPVGGTTLASGRLDRFLSVTLNAFDLIPALRASPAYDLFQSFMVGLVRTKADPEQLPGLSAMRPLGPVIRLLNRADIDLGGRLINIAGDFEGAGMLRKLAEMAADFFFEDENDFVVNTPSMSRGLRRTEPAETVDVAGEAITHFTYFSDPAARMAVLSALLPQTAARVAALPFAARSVPRAAPAEPEPFIDYTASDDTAQPVCFILPGVMGSHIYQDDDWIWTNPVRLATGGVHRLRHDAPKVEPGPIIDGFYGDMARHVGRNHKAIAFSYDWRASIMDTADVLAERVRRELAVPGRPIRFLAHSMGGLVVRAFQHRHKDLWAQIKARGGTRFVMLGTPNGGAVSMIENMLGRTRQMKLIEAADITNDMRELLAVITALPGLAQLLPNDGAGMYLAPSFWEQLHAHDGANWVIPPHEALAAGRAGHKLLREHVLDPETTCYVAGLGEAATPSLVHLVDAGKNGGTGGREIEVRGTYEGDGTVTWATGIPAGIPTWYMNAVHGDLGRTTSAFPALLDLLETGTTQVLPQSPPARARGAVRGDVVIAPARIETYPDAEDITAAALGAPGPRARPAPAQPAERAGQAAPLAVSVAHGDLRFARYPVAVGHYLGDPITGAEAALDACLGGHLSHVRDLGLYPGAVNTCEVLLREGHTQAGAIVVGLGTFGDLTPGKLRDSFRQAVLRYAMMLRRRNEEAGGTQATLPPIGLSSLVIGNRGADITVHQSVEALLEAVVDANALLGDTPVSHLQFVELFDDTAYKAADALERISLNSRVKHGFTHRGMVESLYGARLRAGFGTASDTWQRMRITAVRDRPLRLGFEAISHGAKAPVQYADVQDAVRAQLVARSGKSTVQDRDLGRMLFELMVPNALKSFAKDDQKLLVIVDEQTAQFPWELLEDDYAAFAPAGANAQPGAEIKPLVVRTPVIRQLVTGGTMVPHAARQGALVVGDPLAEGMAELPAAQAEARSVADVLTPFFAAQLADAADPEAPPPVETMIRPTDGFAVLESLICQQHKLLHVAAHGVLGAPGSDEAPGMVLGGGLRLTAYEVRQMRYLPELVFLNCCHLGKIAPPDLGQIAANLAHVFIQQGARAVVAAGWAVDDAAAECFARAFYGSMLAGSSFGDAVHHARMETYAQHPHTNTWGAYQCYGDPEYRLGGTASARTARRGDTRYFAAEHATRAAINIAQDACTSTAPRTALIAALSNIDDQARQGWHEDAAWCEAMARAYGELDVFARAIALMEQALALPSGGARIGLIAQLQDLKVRAAFTGWTRARSAEDAEGTRSAARDVAQTVQSALKTLEKLDDLTGLLASGADGGADAGRAAGRTSAREALKGDALRHLAMIETGPARRTYVQQMTAAYGAGMEPAAPDAQDETRLACFWGWLTGHVVQGQSDAAGLPIDVWLERLHESARAADRRAPSFWHALRAAELAMLPPLCGALDAPIPPDLDLNAQFTRLEAGLRAAWARGGSYRQARLLRAQVAFLGSTMAQAHRDKRAWLGRVDRLVAQITQGV